jgi:hypothetical protein
MIEAAKVYKEQVTRAAQQSASQWQRLGAAFRGMVSVALMKRRALSRLAVVRDHVRVIAVNFLNVIRVGQALSSQMTRSGSRLQAISHYRLHAASPYSPKR